MPFFLRVEDPFRSRATQNGNLTIRVYSPSFPINAVVN